MKVSELVEILGRLPTDAEIFISKADALSTPLNSVEEGNALLEIINDEDSIYQRAVLLSSLPEVTI